MPLTFCCTSVSGPAFSALFPPAPPTPAPPSSVVVGVVIIVNVRILSITCIHVNSVEKGLGGSMETLLTGIGRTV